MQSRRRAYANFAKRLDCGALTAALALRGAETKRAFRHI
jgi:hypothetical protein